VKFSFILSYDYAIQYHQKKKQATPLLDFLDFFTSTLTLYSFQLATRTHIEVSTAACLLPVIFEYEEPEIASLHHLLFRFLYLS